MFGWPRRALRPPSEDKRRVLDALTGYPPYSPPVWDPGRSFHESAAEYETFFLANKQMRIEALRVFLAKFGVALSADEDGLRAISAWCPRYADLLVDGLESDAVADAYRYFESPWTGPLLGLSPIFDLGIYSGECILSHNPKLKWEPVRAPESSSVTHNIIFGRRFGALFDPIRWMYTECRNIRAEKLARARRLRAHPGAGSLDEGWIFRKVESEAMELCGKKPKP
jgi:hypothetical protein